MAKRVNAEEFEAEVLKASLPVIVEFYSDSCIQTPLYFASSSDIKCTSSS